MNYCLIRDRRRRLSVIIGEGGEVVVRAPLRMPLAEIEGFLASKQKWIAEKSALRRAEADRFARVFSLQAFLFQGRQYLPGEVFVWEGEARRVPERLDPARLKSWYRAFVEAEAARKYRSLYEQGLPPVRIGSFRKKWGSCDSLGQIRLSFRLAMLPEELFDYVLIHEACHLKELNHSPRFWAEVEALCPDFKRRRKALKACSALNSFL